VHVILIGDGKIIKRMHKEKDIVALLLNDRTKFLFYLSLVTDS